ncbi:response regulator transcription factor [Candidatus Binatia bacterium]|nr:response regulator transcription factor [Candidatus Binatia bacterium]
MHDVLLIEDDLELGRLLRGELQRAGHRCRWATTGALALLEVERRKPDVVLLDLQLPDRSGFDLLPELRRRSPMPVIVVTARLLGDDKVRALDLGADDYITKPFWAEELLARMRAVVRRTRQDPAAADVQELGTLRIEVLARRVSVGGVDCALTPTEFNLLQHLARRPGQALRREQLIDAVLPNEGSATEALQVHISRLRRKVGAEGWRVKTVWGIGYRLDAGAEEDR